MSRYEENLRKHNLRPTRQRMLISELLFGGGHRHFTAEQLRAEVDEAGGDMSLATIYNTLNQFSEVGLLREIKVEESVTYYDTNIDHHHHFYDPEQNALTDIPNDQLTIDRIPEAPKGRQVERVDVIVRLAKEG